MVEPVAIPESDLRERIVAAAFALFQRYGYTKTTMAEIAEDAGMSAANLYRYFDHKQDIAAECCNRCMSQRLDTLRAIVRNARLGAAEKLEGYALAMVEHTHEMASPDSRVGELIETITRERPAMVHDKIRTHTGLLAEVLGCGNESGEFDVPDVIGTAKDLYSALVVFDVPLFVGLFARREFEARAKGTVKLLLSGLRKR
jgi:AcrR family transcriptional regulator